MNQSNAWKLTFAKIFVANMTMYLGMQMVDSLISVYADYLGASAAIAGLVTSLFALTALIFKVFAGPAIDSFSKKHVIIFALIIIAAAFFGMSFSKAIPGLMVFRLLHGVGRAFSATCFLALVSDVIPKEKFSVGIGIFTIAQAIAQAVGPSMGLAISGHFGYRVMFLCSMGFVLLALVLICLIKTADTPRKKFHIAWNTIVAKEAAVPTVMLFFLMSSFCVISSFLILYANKKGIEGVSMFFVIYAGTMLVSRPLLGGLTDKFGTTRVLIPSFICFLIPFIMISYADSLPVLLAAAFISAFGYGATTPAVQALCLKSVPAERRGAASSTSYIGLDLGNLAGPVVAGMLIERIGYESMWLCMTIPTIIALIIAIAYRKRTAEIEKGF